MKSPRRLLKCALGTVIHHSCQKVIIVVWKCSRKYRLIFFCLYYLVTLTYCNYSNTDMIIVSSKQVTKVHKFNKNKWKSGKTDLSSTVIYLHLFTKCGVLEVWWRMDCEQGRAVFSVEQFILRQRRLNKTRQSNTADKLQELRPIWLSVPGKVSIVNTCCCWSVAPVRMFTKVEF